MALPTRSADGRTYTFKIRRGFRFSPPANQPVTAQTFNAGGADYTDMALYPSTTIAARASSLAARYGPDSAAAARGRQQYFVNPGVQLDYFILNTHRTLFRDVRARQAVNYAIDRRTLAHMGDAFQPLPGQPTDHHLPPGMPGFRDANVYPSTPNVLKARDFI